MERAMSESSCEVFDPLVAELALGVLEGKERADTLAHVEHCRACQHELLLMGDVADRLAQLTPAAEPPAGFETRVLATIEAARAVSPRPRPATIRRRSSLGSGSRRAASGGRASHLVGGRHRGGGRLPASDGSLPASPTTGRSRWWRAGAGVAAGVALVAAVGAGGWALGHHAASPAPAAAPAGSGKGVVAELLSDHHRVGEVIVRPFPGLRHGRSYWWMSMAVEAPLGTSRVDCELQQADGKWLSVGSFALSGGSGYWAAQVPATSSPFVAARLIDEQGKTVGAASWGAPGWSD